MRALSSASTASAEEVAKFAALSSRWWAPDGPMRLLHLMNPLRIQYMLAHLPGRTLRGRTVLDVGCGAGILCEVRAARARARAADRARP